MSQSLTFWSLLCSLIKMWYDITVIALSSSEQKGTKWFLLSAEKTLSDTTCSSPWFQGRLQSCLVSTKNSRFLSSWGSICLVVCKRLNVFSLNPKWHMYLIFFKWSNLCLLQSVRAAAKRSCDEQELPASRGPHPLPAAALHRLQPVRHEPG